MLSWPTKIAYCHGYFFFGACLRCGEYYRDHYEVSRSASIKSRDIELWPVYTFSFHVILSCQIGDDHMCMHVTLLTGIYSHVSASSSKN